jgi:hypothetical protein
MDPIEVEKEIESVEPVETAETEEVDPTVSDQTTE